jgi:hypothetical protein
LSTQIYVFKPTSSMISPIFLQIVIYLIGNAWAAHLPRPSSGVGRRLKILDQLFGFINPGPFTLEEVCNCPLLLPYLGCLTASVFSQHTVASLVAITADRGNLAVLN